MKRDLTLVRDIVLWLDDHSEWLGFISAATWAEYVEAFQDRSGWFEHWHLCREANLGAAVHSGITITPKGSDFADLVRDDAVWREVIRRIEAVGLTGVPFDVLCELAARVQRERLGLSHSLTS